MVDALGSMASTHTPFTISFQTKKRYHTFQQKFSLFSRVLRRFITRVMRKKFLKMKGVQYIMILYSKKRSVLFVSPTSLNIELQIL